MAQASGQTLFETAVLPHLDAAYNLARWLMRNAQDAEDVVQDAVVRALTYFPGFRGENPRAWLLQIVRNAAYASMKLNRGRMSAGGGDDDAIAEIADPADGPEALLMKEEDRARVARLLAALPVDLRETLILRELEEMSYKEVAEVTEVPIGTVMSRLWRGRRMLAQAMKAGEGAP